MATKRIAADRSIIVPAEIVASLQELMGVHRVILSLLGKGSQAYQRAPLQAADVTRWLKPLTVRLGAFLAEVAEGNGHNDGKK